MCSACSDASRGEWRWSTYHRASPPQADQDAARDTLDTEMRQLAAAEEAEFDAHMAAADVVECRGCDSGEAAEQQQQGDVRFLTHAEERAALAKPIWTEVASQIPRAQHDRRLAMPQGATQRRVDMDAVRRAFPARRQRSLRPGALGPAQTFWARRRVLGRNARCASCCVVLRVVARERVRRVCSMRSCVGVASRRVTA